MRLFTNHCNVYVFVLDVKLPATVCVCVCVCVCVYIHDTALCVNVCVERFFSLCVYIWQAEDDVGRAPTLTHSVLIWCLVQRFCPYLMTRGRPCPFMMSENEEGVDRVHWVQSKTSIQTEHAGLKERAGFLYLNWIQVSWLCDVCAVVLGLFWMPRAQRSSHLSVETTEYAYRRSFTRHIVWTGRPHARTY